MHIYISWDAYIGNYQGNVGLIFTKGDLKEVSEEVAKYKVYCFGLSDPITLIIIGVFFYPLSWIPSMFRARLSLLQYVVQCIKAPFYQVSC